MIGDGAFRNCPSLASVTLGASVTHIGDGLPLQRCSSLASITWGESVTQCWGQVPFKTVTSLGEHQLWVSL